MGKWSEVKGQYPPHVWYPPQPYPLNSNFPVKKEGAPGPSGPSGASAPLMPFSISEPKATERDIAASNIWPLMPALAGAGASFLLLLIFNHKTWRIKNDDGPESREVTRSAPVGSAVIVIYSILATAGVSYYVYRVLTSTDGSIISAFIPVVSAITIFIIYFAAAYNLEYQLVPGSFTGENIGNDIVSEIFTFVYFSISTFTTASMGDLSPVSNASRMLVSIEVLFFVFIFIITLGLVFFADP
ncbi:potassium channel family protein [Desulfitobacterium sp.]|uniref:potassium channel family protein n=1 Tax=Desulfitobacterium sp. TaxID=49981 RepID=UPI002B20094E|nr:potassium channel family protein [Desulfitobacterium sp.]MEA4900810.1 potassium channel family protein [Desulfitobacterium sp.]